MLALWTPSASAQLNWIDTDLGGPVGAGYTVTNGDGTLDIFGGGSDIWNTTSQCHYRYAWASGTTWDMTMQVKNFVGVDATWSKVELMVDWADPTVGPQGNDAFIADMLTLPTGNNSYGQDQYRVSRGAGADWSSIGAPAPVFPNTWLRIHRNGSVFSILYSTDGTTWTKYIDIDTASNASLGGGSTTVFGTPWPDAVCVGIAVTGHSDVTQLADATVANVTATFPAIAAPTVVNTTVQVSNTTAVAGSEASFAFATTNNSSPNVVLPNYQWYRNNVAISNATGTSLTFLAAAADNNAQYYCKATVPPPYNTTVTSINSATGTLAVATSGIVLTNGLKVEFWTNNDNRAGVEAGNVGPASRIYVRHNVDDPGGLGNDYVQRFSGYFIPPTSTNYVFFLASDDDADLFLSTDSTAANKQMICQETGYSGIDQWLEVDYNGIGGVGTAGTWSQQRSDLFTPDDYVTIPWANGIPLVAGQRYYIEGVHHQAGGGDNFCVTYQTYDQVALGFPNLTNGTPSLLQASNHNIAFISYQDTTPTWTLQPSNTVVTAFQSGGLYAAAVDGGEFAPNYQWYSNGVPVVGATSASLIYGSMPNSANGSQYYCVATAVMSGLSSTSSVATINVASPIFEKGWSKIEYWYGLTSLANLTNGSIGTAQYVITSPTMEQASVGNTAGVNYSSRMTTLFYPPTTGLYDFYDNSDDQSDLFVSSTSDPSGNHLVAEEDGYSNPWQWQAVGGGNSTVAQKSSATWSPDGGATVPWANGIQMTAGQPYYIELDHIDTGGGNNSEATFTLHGAGAPANGAVSAMTGNLIGIYVPRCFNVSFNTQPTNVTVAAYGSANFTAASTSDSTVAVGTTGNPQNLWTNTTVYQWYRNGAAVAGATAPTYTISPVLPSDSNVYCTTRALGYVDNSDNTLWLTSSVANITVTGVVAPHLTYSAFYTNGNYVPFTGYVTNYITVTFDSPMDPTMLANVGNYTVGGGVSILGVVVSPDNKSVSLMVSGVPSFPLNVTVSSSLTALGGGLPVANTITNVVMVPLMDTDIGAPGADPAVAGTLINNGPNAYIISAEGSDIYNNQDGFNFAYEMKTNDFDVVVRQKSTTHTSNWAKGGLMVRETLDAFSRNWNIVNDPASADGIGAPDGTGNGANAVECNARIAVSGTSAGWNFQGSPVPVYPNAWVRLKRVGDLLSAYYSTNGTSWTLQATNDPAYVGDSNSLPAVVYVGICTTAHNNDVIPNPTPLVYLNTSTYDNYNSSYVPVAGAATLKASMAGNNITITWLPNSGHLEASPALSGPNMNWQPVTGGTGGTATMPMSGNAWFFRVVNP